MKKRYIMYIIISIFCLIAVAYGVYDQFFRVKKKPVKQKNEQVAVQTENTVEKEESKIDNTEELKKEFNNMFNNKIELNGFNQETVNKIDPSQEIVYTAESLKTDKEDKYEISINIPGINIKSDVVLEFNTITQKKFVEKSAEIINKLSNNENTQETNSEIQDETVYNENSENSIGNLSSRNRSGINITIYSVDYMAFVNKNILSVVIRAKLKEGESSQRTIIQTYNYNLATNQKVAFTDILQSKNVEVSKAESTINSYIKARSEYDNQLSETENSKYIRNIEDRMYKPANTELFFLDEEENLYAIYAYGNDNETTEFDIIEIK